MEIINQKKNYCGTMSFALKMGRMKKAEDFVTYPISNNGNTRTLSLQSHHRWAELNLETGEVELSARRAQYANSLWLMCCKMNGTAETDKATPEQLGQIKSAVRATAASLAGNSFIKCDNSGAAAI